jgi:hypothetical protein
MSFTHNEQINLAGVIPGELAPPAVTLRLQDGDILGQGNRAILLTFAV